MTLCMGKNLPSDPFEKVIKPKQLTNRAYKALD